MSDNNKKDESEKEVMFGSDMLLDEGGDESQNPLADDDFGNLEETGNEEGDQYEEVSTGASDDEYEEVSTGASDDEYEDDEYDDDGDFKEKKSPVGRIILAGGGVVLFGLAFGFYEFVGDKMGLPTVFGGDDYEVAQTSIPSLPPQVILTQQPVNNTGIKNIPVQPVQQPVPNVLDPVNVVSSAANTDVVVPVNMESIPVALNKRIMGIEKAIEEIQEESAYNLEQMIIYTGGINDSLKKTSEEIKTVSDNVADNKKDISENQEKIEEITKKIDAFEKKEDVVAVKTMPVEAVPVKKAPVKMVDKKMDTMGTMDAVKVDKMKPVKVATVRKPKANLSGMLAHIRPVKKPTVYRWKLKGFARNKIWIQSAKTGKTISTKIGDNIPGLGTIMEIHVGADNNNWFVVTSNGIIKP